MEPETVEGECTVVLAGWMTARAQRCQIRNQMPLIKPPSFEWHIFKIYKDLLLGTNP